MPVWANFYMPNLKYHFKHKKISSEGILCCLRNARTNLCDPSTDTDYANKAAREFSKSDPRAHMPHVMFGDQVLVNLIVRYTGHGQWRNFACWRPPLSDKTLTPLKFLLPGDPRLLCSLTNRDLAE